MNCTVNEHLKLRSHNTSYCLIEVVTKAGLTVHHLDITSGKTMSLMNPGIRTIFAYFRFMCDFLFSNVFSYCGLTLTFVMLLLSLCLKILTVLCTLPSLLHIITIFVVNLD